MADLRASDADRELIADGLRAHHAAGRIDHEELEERLGAAYAARTRGELSQLVADLPAPATPAAPRSAGTPDASWRWLDAQVLPALMARGFRVVEHREPQWIVVERERRPWWVWLLVVLLFPFGLLALLIKDRERAVLTVGRAGVEVSGEAAYEVRGELVRLSRGR